MTLQRRPISFWRPQSPTLHLAFMVMCWVSPFLNNLLTLWSFGMAKSCCAFRSSKTSPLYLITCMAGRSMISKHRSRSWRLRVRCSYHLTISAKPRRAFGRRPLVTKLHGSRTPMAISCL
jgi:hypothetical protein